MVATCSSACTPVTSTGCPRRRACATSSRSSRPPSAPPRICRAAEARAAERIAEAERAADLRVQAADDEAEQVLAEADAAAARQAEQEAEAASNPRASSLVEARLVARDVLRDGEIVSGHLRELADVAARQRRAPAASMSATSIKR